MAFGLDADGEQHHVSGVFVVLSGDDDLVAFFSKALQGLVEGDIYAFGIKLIVDLAGHIVIQCIAQDLIAALDKGNE